MVPNLKVTRISFVVIALCMGIAGVKWKCPSCNIDVGGSMGELKNHIKNVHRHNIPKKEEK